MAKQQTPETALKRQCTKLLKTFGGFSLPIPGGAYGVNGAPDRICWYMGRGVAIEFKSGRNGLMPAQKAIKAGIEGAGGEYYLVRTPQEFIDAMGLPVKALF
jgi:hypothetical protein